MTYSYRMHPLIQHDLEEGFKWYEEKQKGLGDRFMKAVKAKLDQVLLNPETSGSKTNKAFREAIVDYFPYLIVYKTDKRKKEIYVTSIHHMKKMPRKKFRK